MKPSQFLDKWSSHSKQANRFSRPGGTSVKAAQTVGTWWHDTPQRLYWALSYDMPQPELLEMSKDLLSVENVLNGSAENALPGNSSVSKALLVVSDEAAERDVDAGRTKRFETLADYKRYIEATNG